jgi:hypothetical protein
MVAGLDRLSELSLSRRLEALDAEFREAGSGGGNLAIVALVFDAGPVRGSSAIDADFAGKALQDYQELLTKCLSVKAQGALSERGPLSDRMQAQARMNVTSLVHGSFGFVLEEDGEGQQPLFESPVSAAVTAVTDLLTAFSAVDEEAFTKKVAEVDARIYKTAKRFIGLLHKEASTLKISEQIRDLALDSARIARAHDRMTHTDVEQVELPFDGDLLGIVPVQRRFEFRKNDGGEVISGRVSENLSADYLERIDRGDVVAIGQWRAVIQTKTIQSADGRQVRVMHTLTDLLPI